MSDTKVKVFKMAGAWIWDCRCCEVGGEFRRGPSPWGCAVVAAYRHAEVYHDLTSGEPVWIGYV